MSRVRKKKVGENLAIILFILNIRIYVSFQSIRSQYVMNFEHYNVIQTNPRKSLRRFRSKTYFHSIFHINLHLFYGDSFVHQVEVFLCKQQVFEYLSPFYNTLDKREQIFVSNLSEIAKKVFFFLQTCVHRYRLISSHIIQNIAEICQKCFQSFIATEIFSQHFCFKYCKIFQRNITILTF